jgi:hypothetical protein
MGPRKDYERQKDLKKTGQRSAPRSNQLPLLFVVMVTNFCEHMNNLPRLIGKKASARDEMLTSGKISPTSEPDMDLEAERAAMQPGGM